MTVVERLRGCPSGATRDALRINGHTDGEIAEAVLSGQVVRRLQHYAKPRDFVVEWFMAI
jgi:hypothetical protein